MLAVWQNWKNEEFDAGRRWWDWCWNLSVASHRVDAKEENVPYWPVWRQELRAVGGREGGRMGGAAASAPAAALPAASNPLILCASNRFRSSFMHVRYRALRRGCFPECITVTICPPRPLPPRATERQKYICTSGVEFQNKSFYRRSESLINERGGMWKNNWPLQRRLIWKTGTTGYAQKENYELRKYSLRYSRNTECR